MKSHELLREVFRDTSPKAVADHVGLSLSMIYKWAEATGENGSGTVNPLDRVMSLVEATDDDRIIKWLCSQNGGYFIRNPEHQAPEEKELMQAANRILQQFASLLSLIAHAAADNCISEEEAGRIRSNWQDLKATTEGFVAHCERGEFSAVKKELEDRGSNGGNPC